MTKTCIVGLVVVCAFIGLAFLLPRLITLGRTGRWTLATRDARLAERVAELERAVDPVPTPADPCYRPPDEENPPSVAPAGEDAASVLTEKPRLGVEIYGAEWCAPCQQLKLILPELNERGYVAAYWDIEEHPNPHATYLPTTYLYRDGQYLTHIVGMTTIEEIERAFQ